MKKIVKYLIPLIISFLVLCFGVFLYFSCAPENTLISSEIIKVSKSTQRATTNYPWVYKTTCYITLNLYATEDLSDETITINVQYTTTNGYAEYGSFNVNGLKEGKNLIQDKIFGSFEGNSREQKVQKVTALAYKLSSEEESHPILAYQTSTFGRSISYLIFAGGGISVAVFGVLIAYELVSPVKNPERKVFKVAVTTQPDPDEEEKKKAEREIEKLKLENEQLKLQKEILEKHNKKVKCEHCGMESSAKNDICPGCKAPLKQK